MSAMAKGRSSSRALNSILRRLNALRLAAGLSVVVGYVNTLENPADKPSRQLQKVKKKLK